MTAKITKAEKAMEEINNLLQSEEGDNSVVALQIAAVVSNYRNGLD